MSKFQDIESYNGEDRGYRGKLLGVCIKCNGTPKVRRHKMWRSFIVTCTRCDLKTLDYPDMHSAVKAWNVLVTRKVGE